LYEIVQHTADIRMRVSAPSLGELFADALRGLMDVVKPEGVANGPARAEIHLTAPDTTALLIDFLNEVLTRSHIDHAVYPRVTFRLLSGTALDADLSGFRVAGFGEDVKAVTYHEADVRESGGNWSTTLVFDV